MSKGKIEQANHALLRYANCWEDADILLQGLQLEPNKRILSIAAAGDNTLALLSTAPVMVTAVDVNPTQLQLLELKRAAICTLDYEALLAFLGILPTNHRQSLLALVSKALPKSSRFFWASHIDWVMKGVIHAGRFENYFRLFRLWALPLVHGHKHKLALVRPKSAAEQAEFYGTIWDNSRWKWLFRVFFGRRLMGLLGRDPSFFAYVSDNVGESIKQKADSHLKSMQAQQNYFLHYILFGQFTSHKEIENIQAELPVYLRFAHQAIIRDYADRITIVQGWAETALTPNDEYDVFNLSNIFEYMPQHTFRELGTKLGRSATPNARLAYWNLLVDRQLHVYLPAIFRHHPFSEQLNAQDKCFFYKRFVLDYIV